MAKSLKCHAVHNHPLSIPILSVLCPYFPQNHNYIFEDANRIWNGILIADYNTVLSDHSFNKQDFLSFVHV